MADHSSDSQPDIPPPPTSGTPAGASSWPPTAAEVDAAISDYLVIEPLDSDSCGASFKARQTKFNRLVAIRLLPAGLSSQADFSVRLGAEMETAGQILHPHGAAILDFGETEAGGHFLATAFIEGNPLGAIIQSGTVTAQHADGWMPQLLAYLETLHSADTCHGWLNPGNIWIEEDGNLKVGGFGLANFASLFSGAAAMNAAFPSYLAPECAAPGGLCTPSADLYAAGALLYHLLTGTIPHGILQPPSQLVQGLGNRYDAVLTRALHPDPASRFQSAAEFHEALSAALVASPPAGAAPRPRTAPSPSPSPAPSPSRPKLATAATGGVPTVKPRGKKSTPSPKPEPAPEKTHAVPKGVVVLLGFLALLICGLGLKLWLGKDDDHADGADEDDAHYADADSDDDYSGSEGDVPDMSRVTEVSQLLIQLRQLAPHDPNLMQYITSNEAMIILTAHAETVERMIYNDDSPQTQLLTSWEFLDMLKELRSRARLTAPVRSSQTGTLLSWQSDGLSEPEPAAEVLPGFSGSTENIVALAGNLEIGAALSGSGAISSWGSSAAPPDVRGIASIDCDGEHFAALLESQSVMVWGNVPEGEAAAIDDWSNVARIAVGGSHVLGITREFKLLSAGEGGSGPLTIPEDAYEFDFVAIAAEGARAAALAADGTLFYWEKPGAAKRSHYPDMVALRFDGTGGLFGINLDGLFVRGLEKGHFDPLELAGGEEGIHTLPRMSPSGGWFALQPGGSRWIFTQAKDSPPGGNLDPATCEQRARGSFDLILGEEWILSISPTRTGTASTDGGPKRPVAPPLEMLTIDDLSVPAALGYREWSPSGGKKRRARLLSREDDSHIRLRFADGTEATMPLDRFNDDDRAYVSDWKGIAAVNKLWQESVFANLPRNEFLAGSGFVSVDFQMATAGPMVEGLAGAADLKLVVDTGASISMISEAKATELDLPLQPGGLVQTWQGTLRASKTKIPELRFGGLVISNLEVLVVDFPSSGSGGFDMDGLMGIDVLRSHDAAYDFGEQQLLFRQVSKIPSAASAVEQAAYRDWTSAAGTTIRARFAGGLDKASGKVALEKPDGSAIEVPLGQLSGIDLEYLDLQNLASAHQRELDEMRRSLTVSDYMKLDPQLWEVIDYRVQGGQQIVEVNIEGRELKFFVDTGAKSSKVSEAAVKSMGRSVAEMPVIGRGGGLEGKPVPIRAGDFKTVQIGSRTFYDFRMHVYDFEHQASNRLSGTANEGVIGADLLEQMGAIVDHDTKQIILPAK